MEIESRKDGTTMVVTISGRMDAVTAPTFEKRFNELITDGETSFVVDFTALDYISSAGLRALLAIAKKLKGKGGEVSFANIKGTVKEVFDISGFGTIFQMHDSVAAALAGIS